MLSLAGGVAAVECARGFGAHARLSWPNDVVCEQRKLAGVLAELGPEGSVLLGIGMNLAARASDLPESDRLTPTSLLLETGAAPSAPAALIVSARRRCGRSRRSSTRRARRPSQRVRARSTRSRARALQLRLAGGEVVEGTGAGIADDGCLLVRGTDGVRAYASGEVARLS